jgi:hypothetical protein
MLLEDMRPLALTKQTLSLREAQCRDMSTVGACSVCLKSHTMDAKCHEKAAHAQIYHRKGFLSLQHPLWDSSLMLLDSKCYLKELLSGFCQHKQSKKWPDERKNLRSQFCNFCTLSLICRSIRSPWHTGPMQYHVVQCANIWKICITQWTNIFLGGRQYYS